MNYRFKQASVSFLESKPFSIIHCFKEIYLVFAPQLYFLPFVDIFSQKMPCLLLLLSAFSLRGLQSYWFPQLTDFEIHYASSRKDDHLGLEIFFYLDYLFTLFHLKWE